MNHADPQSTVPTPLTARDSLAALLHDVITSPNQGAQALAKSCATIALAFVWLDQDDERLAARHRDRREQSLVKALARALAIVEMTDLDEAVRITAELEDDVRPLVGGPIVLVCPTLVTLVEPIPEPICAFGDVCVHKFPGGAA